MNKWVERYLRLAREYASWSKDRSTQVGAVIVLKDGLPGPPGYNGFPRSVNDDIEERHLRPKKYKYTEHAERNALFNSVRMNVNIEGSTMYVTHPPCPDCARGIIQSRVTAVVVDPRCRLDVDFAQRWGADEAISREMFAECGVSYRFADEIADAA